MKKVLLFLGMFLFIFNVKALTFNVNVTNIENEGNNGTIGSITNIDIPNKTIDAYFQDIGDEVSFSITVTNTGDRAGTLRSIDVASTNDKIEYSSNLPEGGLAINGNDTNKVIVTAKVKEGAVNGKTTSEVKIKYTYDEGSCPEGEILSEDESMCLCPEGMERNENGICVKPEKKIECADDEIYNETKKICEKKVVPVNPSNPKTLDNIILITLLFFVSGLGIYAVLFKKLKTNKQKVTGAVITGVTTLTLSFTVLASVFGLDNLLGAIINPITKSKELVVKVNEEIDLIETWDGECSLDVSELTPDNIFQGGTGTESDPYQVKTAEQLSCFAKSINNGTTYEGQYIKQTKNIKLNDNLNEQATNGDLSNAHVWTTAGYTTRVQDQDYNYTRIGNGFFGTYDGDNHIISGLYLTDDSVHTRLDYDNYVGLFAYAKNAIFKNIILSDVYMNTAGTAGSLLGYGYENLTIDNVTSYGTGIHNGWAGSGIVSNYSGNNVGTLIIENTTNNINLTCSSSCSGIIHRMESGLVSEEPTVIFRNSTNNGNISFTGNPSGAAGLFGYADTSNYVLVDNCVNNGNINSSVESGGNVAGILGYAYATKLKVTDSSNTGNIDGFKRISSSGMLVGAVNSYSTTIIDNCYNSGNVTTNAEFNGDTNDYFGGIIGYASDNTTITNSYNTGYISIYNSYVGGITAHASGTIENCYNTGNITGYGYVGGIFGYGENMIITKTYNTATIRSVPGPMTGGIVGYHANKVEYSYNTGNIINDGGGYTGGICGHYCNEVRNSYNRGDVIANNSPVDIGGITGYGMDLVENVYNSGNVTYTNSTRYGNSGYVAGISAQGSTVNNAYNLGNVTFNTISMPDAYEPNPHVDGIATYANANNSVNAGTVKLVVTEPLLSKHLIQMNGISYWGGNNNFNAGKIEIDDSALDTPIREDGLSHSIRIGQITETSTSISGNKFNTDPNGFALGCMTMTSPFSSCTLEASQAVGTYTNEDAPSILSIINGDNAFNDELDEDGLPTLKVFNE